MTTKMYSPIWDLDVFFKGGSDSPAFIEHLAETEKEIEAFKTYVHNWEQTNSITDTVELANIIKAFESGTKKTREASAFVSCLQAQNIKDKKADEHRAKLTTLNASFQSALTILDEKLAKYDDPEWVKLMSSAELSELSFILTERRLAATEKLSQKEESLINSLAIDGYHSWSQLYDLVVGNIKIPFQENGEAQLLSVGQAANKFSNPERKIRHEIFEKWENAWEQQSDYLARALNHLAGFRLNVYKERGWEEVLKEPLAINRMENETLQTMWNVIAKNKQPLVRFLNRKAELLGLDKLSWYDLDAPIDRTETKVSYQEGAEFIIENFAQFGEEMASFAKMAFEEKWIEAEDRPGKRPGGFHTYFPESSQSRIFMTYSGTPSNISTLAHELGHGFHTYAMRDQALLNRNYAMNVAETASTFAEMIVSDASVKNARSKEEKIALLEDKIQRSVALLMNIHARFLFETRFYEERKNGMVTVERLNKLMEEAQKEAYGSALSEYHPSFWASKMHFYITGVPFYNFPYTFGFLFSLGIYAEALDEGKGYEEKYIALLKDSASMKVEDLAKKHLQVDLTKPEFWEKAVKLCIDDIEEFLVLTEN